MALNDRLRGVVDWLLEGYPAGVPPKDYIPLGVSITRFTDALPSQQDIARVEERLNRHHHWPLEAS